MIILTLPTPPSVNALYSNRKHGRGKGRIKTAAYRKWIAHADGWLMTQMRNLPKKAITGKLQLIITIPNATRGDTSNYLKAMEDYLVSRQITGDDKHNWSVTIKKDTIMPSCFIEIIPISGT